jgi:hypothetical protein
LAEAEVRRVRVDLRVVVSAAESSADSKANRKAEDAAVPAAVRRVVLAEAEVVPAVAGLAGDLRVDSAEDAVAEDEVVPAVEDHRLEHEQAESVDEADRKVAKRCLEIVRGADNRGCAGR